jgi:putative nucleotidyltransferase with HDIG domain
MSPKLTTNLTSGQGRRVFLRLFLLLATSGLALASLIVPDPIRPNAYPITSGAVASQDVQAPWTSSFESAILTNQARHEAELSVAPVYLAANPQITRDQIEKLRLSLNYITTVRDDPYASPEQKLEDLTALDALVLSQSAKELVLTLDDQRWETVQLEALSVLEQVMRNTLREEQLREARRNISTLISFSLPQDQSSLVVELVSQFIVPNSLPSEEQTALEREKAGQAIQPVMRTFMEGETIVQRGQVINALILESLQHYDLVEPANDMRNSIAAAVLVVLTSAFVVLYFNHRQVPVSNQLRSLAFIAIIFLLFLFAARLIIPNRAVVPYMFPIPAFGLTIASLFSAEVGLIFSLVLGILAGYDIQNSIVITLFYVLTSLCGVLALGRARRVANFFWGGIAIGFTGSAVILAYRLPDISTDWFGIATLVGASFVNGVASASLALLLQFALSQLLGLTTALHLMDLSRPDHPLLQHFMRTAPGSYQHSLQVANLAEQAAEVIGADTLQVRIGALYHDIGKSQNPSFFIENQIPGTPNPHDELDPVTSAKIILSHVEDGVKLARKYRLPPRLINFIKEHHGTLMTRYQYAHALKAVGNDKSLVKEEDFRYPGPEPRTRETALLMLADGCEARARAELPKDEEGIRIIVKKVIEFCQQEGQLDRTSLTLSDLNDVAESFVTTLRNTHHPRIKYPEIRHASDEEVTQQTDARSAAAGSPTTPVSTQSS